MIESLSREPQRLGNEPLSEPPPRVQQAAYDGEVSRLREELSLASSATSTEDA